MSELVLDLLKYIVHMTFYNLPRHVVLLSIKCDLYNRTFSAEIMDDVIVCRIKTVQPRVSAPDIPTIKNVAVSTQAGSNKGTIDVVWEVSKSNMCLHPTKHMLPRRYCINVYVASSKCFQPACINSSMAELLETQKSHTY